MSLKFKITLLHIFISFVTLIFIYMVYDSYIISQEKEIEKKLSRILKLNQNYMKKSLAKINRLLENQKTITQKIHLSIHKELKTNPNIKLDYLKQKMLKEFNLVNKDLDIEVFLLDRKYKIIDSTNKNRINLDLNTKPKAKDILDSLENEGEHNFSNDVLVNLLDYEIKSFSYSKLEKYNYLGFGLIYKDISNQKKDFYEMIELSNINMDMFCILNDKNKEYYESLVEYKRNNKLTSLNRKIDDLIIESSKTWEIKSKKEGDILRMFIPLLKKENLNISIPGNIVLTIDFDISEENLFFNTILKKLILFVLMHFFLIFLIYYFTRRYQKIEKKLNKQIEINKELVSYNKQFISNMVHQIRTPFAVIMTNLSILEIYVSKKTEEYIFQIIASINLLTNSYENLSYFISLDNLEYKKREINISDFLKQRVLFFDQIAKANRKNLIVNIKNNVVFNINDMEIERIVDNTIAISIEKSSLDKNILISFNDKCIEFKVLTNNTDENNIFDKKRKMIIKDTTSLGIGIYLIKKICMKYGILYEYKVNPDGFTIKYTW